MGRDVGLGRDLQDPVDEQVLPHERLDLLDLAAVGEVGLDQEVVDLGGDRVRVLGDDRREQVRRADRVQHGGARAVAAGQHQPERVPAGLGPDAVRVDDRRDDVLAVARHDDQRPRPDALEHVLRLHRPDRDAADDLVEVRAGVDRLAVDALEDHRQRRVGEDRAVREHAEQRDAVAGQATLQGPRQVRLGEQVDLVHDGPGDRDAGALEQRLVEHDLVDRPADAALATRSPRAIRASRRPGRSTAR